MDSIDQIDEETVINVATEELEIQDAVTCFIRLSLYEGECLSML